MPELLVHHSQPLYNYLKWQVKNSNYSGQHRRMHRKRQTVITRKSSPASTDRHWTNALTIKNWIRLDSFPRSPQVDMIYLSVCLLYHVSYEMCVMWKRYPLPGTHLHCHLPVSSHSDSCGLWFYDQVLVLCHYPNTMEGSEMLSVVLTALKRSIWKHSVATSISKHSALVVVV